MRDGGTRAPPSAGRPSRLTFSTHPPGLREAAMEPGRNPTSSPTEPAGLRQHCTQEAEPMSIHKDRVVLAYSGGLDTSVAIGWIGE